MERGTLEVAKSLVAAGHDSQVLSAGGRMVKELETDGSRHITWNLGKEKPDHLAPGEKAKTMVSKGAVRHPSCPLSNASLDRLAGMAKAPSHQGSLSPGQHRAWVAQCESVQRYHDLRRTGDCGVPNLPGIYPQ